MKDNSLNNFDSLRIFLALVVFIFHVSVLNGYSIFMLSPGPVECFFVISGYLIVKSYLMNSSIKEYSKSRFFRIYPLYIMVIFSTVAFGFFSTEVGGEEYFIGAIKYLASNMFFMNFLFPSLPGVLSDDMVTQAVNGSLWTIKIEVMFYFCVPLIYGYLSKFIEGKVITIFLFFFSCVFGFVVGELIQSYELPLSINKQLPSLLSYFMVGAYFNYIKKDIFLIGFLLPFFIFLSLNFDGYLLSPITAGLIVYTLAFIAPKIKVSKKIGDLSYGIYIWHFPIVQALIWFGFFSCFWFGALISFILVLSMSYISWHFIEVKFLARKKVSSTSRVVL